jgi:hypothetical protein
MVFVRRLVFTLSFNVFDGLYTEWFFSNGHGERIRGELELVRIFTQSFFILAQDSYLFARRDHEFIFLRKALKLGNSCVYFLNFCFLPSLHCRRRIPDSSYRTPDSPRPWAE